MVTKTSKLNSYNETGKQFVNPRHYAGRAANVANERLSASTDRFRHRRTIPTIEGSDYQVHCAKSKSNPSASSRSSPTPEQLDFGVLGQGSKL